MRILKASEKDRFLQILAQAEYELLDGVSIPNIKRTFGQTETDTIKGVCKYIEQMVDYCDRNGMMVRDEYEAREGQKAADREEKTRKDVVYIAGPITGHDDYLERFCTAEIVLDAEGWIVLNPADLPQGMSREKYMPICLTMLEQADAIYMLHGWEDSRGATVEYLLAAYQGKEILYE